MKAFHSAREAKEFLISEIVSEAQRENLPLSEVERKMLYFTESGWTLPDIMQVSDDFGREYDQDKYERKISQLVAKVDKHFRKGPKDEYDRWWSAMHLLGREDHYISVMIRSAGLQPRGDQLRLFVTALGIVTIFLGWVLVSIKYDILMPSRNRMEEFKWAIFVCLFLAYFIVRFILGKKRTDNLTSVVLEKLTRMFQRLSGST